MKYRRAWQPGGSYFFTVDLADRGQDLLVAHIGLLRQAVRRVMDRHPFTLGAMVVLPEHLHAILTLPQGDTDFATRWALIKANFSRLLPRTESVSLSRAAKGERGIWQRRYWEHLIRDDEDFHRHVDYIHWNPVKHGLVDTPAAWPHSSIHRYIANGILAADWGGMSVIGDNTGQFGERMD
jgi:putative transposase